MSGHLTLTSLCSPNGFDLIVYVATPSISLAPVFPFQWTAASVECPPAQTLSKTYSVADEGTCHPLKIECGIVSARDNREMVRSSYLAI